ncbi:sugar nucleotide-binding protein [Fusibacter ferrireducens]|uniref:dTDP-4-dehydrorhamnose reductase n=1 Tax=Fusibacter ferrireducens TaxID=2785058 RepID=A0ABR9ZWJ6_9FIRM|nr:sugar nucleotide-binding protein [Fusibacter ferrireducens]MBF4693994.1 sugar nucleotide-binding protein [Fusibacter ferrireducens]
MEKLFILGDSGLVGSAIIELLKEDYDITGVSRDQIPKAKWKHLKFDLESDQLLPILEATQPSVIISCTRGDFEKQLETHREIVKYASQTNAKVYFFSTANVFDGIPNSVKIETDLVNATSAYGHFKINCENLLTEGLAQNAIILRLPMVFGKKSPRVKEIVAALRNEKSIELYENLIFTSIWDTQIAFMFKHILESDLRGIFHLTSKDVMDHTTYYRKFLHNNVLIEKGNIKHQEPYYLALGSTRQELVDYEYSNDDVIRKIKKALKKFKQ